MSAPVHLPIEVLLASWERAMRARNLAPKTIARYLDSARQLADFAAARGLDPLGRQAIEKYLADQAASPQTLHRHPRYRALEQWFKWLVEEDELAPDPWVGMRPPIVREPPVPVLTHDQLRALLKACKGTGSDVVATKRALTASTPTSPGTASPTSGPPSWRHRRRPHATRRLAVRTDAQPLRHIRGGPTRS